MNINRFLKFYDAATDGGGGGGSGNGSGAAGAGTGAGSSGAGSGAGAGAGQAGGGGSGSGAGQAASAGSALPPADVRTLFNEKGEFVNPDWHKSLGLPDGFSKFKSVDGALKSYANLEQAMRSSNKVAVPGENATPEEIALFRSKTGVPDKPEGYEIARPDGIPEKLWSGDRVAAYQAKAHELGLSAKQAQELAKWQAEQLGGDYAQDEATKIASRDAAIADLEKGWGGKDSETYKTNVALAEKGAAAAGLTADILKTTPELSNNPHFIRAMHAVALKLGEDKGAGGDIRQQGGSGGLAINTPEAAAAEISKIRNDPNHAYNNPKASAKDREAAVAYVQRLYAIKNPEQKS